MLFGSGLLVICLRIVTIWLDCGECFSLKNLKVRMIQVKRRIHNQVGFLRLSVRFDLPRPLPWRKAELFKTLPSGLSAIADFLSVIPRFDLLLLLF